jgi:ribonucleoside-diphosphate reductase alpha chain
MGILNCDHPDIIEFIETKAEQNRLSNFNLSVGITDAFMEAVRQNRKYHLINPRTRKKVREVSARAVFELMVCAAWRCGDPGLIFLDTINRTNPLPALGRIEATNPCGELPLLHYESCNLGSINLSKMVNGGRIDWVKLEDCVSWAVRFLDDVIHINSFPLPRIREITLANRKIGLGVMGFADMLITLGIPYNSKKAIAKSLLASAALARERGVFPNYRHSIFYRKQLRLRNATVNTVAPTGTISLIAGCSSGIEPLFAISFVRNVLSGAKLFEVNPLFEEIARKRGFYTKEKLSEMARHGSLQRTRGIPRDIKNLFVTAFDVTPHQHLLIQAAFQKHCDNAVSKTINLPADATVDDVRAIYRMAHRLRCKGITVYRYGCRDEQALSFCDGEGMQPGPEGRLVAAAPDYSGGCAYSSCPL